MLIIQSNYSDAYKELDRLEAMPGPKAVALLDAVFETGYQKVRMDVHIDTGALKATGKSKTKKTVSVWEGHFSFGGSGASPVDYAIYELERGGAHDFMSSTIFLKDLLAKAIAKGLDK